ncbi:hypothetical protein ACXDH7_002371 [Klebsiella quasipneumoniae]
MTDITELAKAAEKYRSTLDAHRNNPRDGVALNAWDDATSKFMELVDNDELNIISGLLEALEKAQQRISRLESRSVKLPKAMSIDGGAYCSAHAHYDSDGDYYDRADVEEMLSVAGIKVEAE